MPPIVVEDGFRIVIYFDDHGPAHVHVKRLGADLKIAISGEPALIRVYGVMSKRDIARAKALVRKHLNLLREAWTMHHG